MPHEPKPKFPEHSVASTDGNSVNFHESTNDLDVALAALAAHPGSQYVKIKAAKAPKAKTPK